MDAERYERAKRLFLEALTRPAAVRAEFVTHAAEDTSLCAEVLELLRLHHEAGGPGGTDADEAPPDRVGPYRILGLLGRGGMGVVYRAQREGEPPVALKVLEAGVLSGRFISRFRREAEALRRLDHPGIARFLEAGTYDSAVGPRPYVAMELVEGVSLRERARDDAWDERARVALVADLADALHHAHEHGIVHRDLKPDNVIVTPAGAPKVLDFGVARVTADDLRGGTLATGTGVLLGTVRYMSPEQAQGLTDEIDRRSDVYALGVLAYELLSGTPPYALHTRSVTRALVQVATTPARPLGEVRPSLRGPLERIVGRALAKVPADRFPTASDMAADLRRHLAGERIRTPGPGAAIRIARFARRRPWAAAGGALGALALLAFAVWSLWSARSPARAAAADAATASACALLDSVDARLHNAPRTERSMRRALALLDEVARELRRAGARAYVPDLRRYAAWREGEARFFLAGLTDDPGGYLDAAAAWERARTPARPPDHRPGLPDTTVNIHSRLVRLWPQQADAGIALAYAELSRDREPAPYSRLAARHGLAAWTVFAAATGIPADPLRSAPAMGTEGLFARALNDLGAATAAAGYYQDSLGPIDSGLALLRRAEEAHALDEDPASLASLEHHVGWAWLLRARLSGLPGDLDSARIRLGRALEMRAALPGSTSVIETRCALAEVWRLAARIGAGASSPADCLERGRVLIQEGLAPLSGSATTARRDRLLVVQAALLTDAAVLGRDLPGLARPESLLASVAERFPRARSPVVYASIERELGRVAAVRWCLTGAEASRNAAIERIAAATEALSSAQHRPFRNGIEAAAHRLFRRGDRSLSLADPVHRP